MEETYTLHLKADYYGRDGPLRVPSMVNYLNLIPHIRRIDPTLR